MSVNLSIMNVSEALAAKLRERAERNHRSLQAELMAILEAAANGTQAGRTNAAAAAYDTAKHFTREQAHDRKLLRKLGV